MMNLMIKLSKFNNPKDFLPRLKLLNTSTWSSRNFHASRLLNTNGSGKDDVETIKIKRATLEDLQKTNDEVGLKIAKEDLKTYKDLMENFFEGYERACKIPEIKPPVKYERSSFFVPPPSENLYNAWAVKTSIKGEKEGLLKGKKIAMKDNIAVAGIPLMNGSKLFESYIPDIDATVTTRILEEGAEIVGKSTCENLCCSGNSYTSFPAPVLNPHDTNRSAGGSSSGSGVLVALKEVDMALGGDQGGSIRLPSSWCGTVGLKPTYGLVPYTGAASLNSHVDHLGPMASTVGDVALLLQVLAGKDDFDHRQPEGIKPVEYSQVYQQGVENMRIGIVKEGFEGCQNDVEQIVKDASYTLQNRGAKVEEVSVKEHQLASDIFSLFFFDANYHTYFLNAGITPGSLGYQDTAFHEHFNKALKTNASDLSEILKLTLIFGKHIRKNYNLKFLCKGQNIAGHLRNGFNTALKQYDVLIMPTIKFTAPLLPKSDASLSERISQTTNMIENTCGFDVTGHPVLSLNAGFSNKLPVGLQLIGSHFDETTVLRVANAIEQNLSH